MPSIPTPAVGTPTYQSWAKSVADRCNGLQCYVTMATNSAIGTDGAFVVIPFDTIVTNVGSRWSVTNKDWTPLSSGVAEVSVIATIAVGSGGAQPAQIIVDVFKNTTQYRIGQIQQAGAVDTFGMSGAVQFPITAGDKVSARAYVSGAAGKTKNVVAGAQMSIRYIG